MTTLLWQFLALLSGTLVLFGVLSAAMTVLTRWIGAERLRRWVGGNPVTAPVKGLVFGVLTPFCSWSTIPVLMSLLSSRVRTSAVAAFFLASPVLDPVLVIGIGWLFGFWVAIWFTVFLTVAILITAHVAERLHLERLVLDRMLAPAGTAALPPAGADVCESQDAPWRDWRAEAHEAARLAVAQVRRLLLPLAVVCAVGVLIMGAAPERLLAQLAGSTQPYAIPAGAVLGVTLYLPTEALAPLGWALRDSGVGLGPIFAFMITAASLSVPELILLSQLVRLRLILGLAMVIVLIAVIGALLVPLIASPR
ncbi:permease [soil metagenome]